MNVIEIKSLTKSYGKSRGIVDVSFNVEEGEIFGFIGPNGAGKSDSLGTRIYESSLRVSPAKECISKRSPDVL